MRSSEEYSTSALARLMIKPKRLFAVWLTTLFMRSSEEYSTRLLIKPKRLF